MHDSTFIHPSSIVRRQAAGDADPLVKDFEPDDPYALVGQGFPILEGYDSAGEMARCFVEELAMIGFSADHVFSLFKNPFYQGPNAAYRTKGEPFVLKLLHEVYGEAEVEEATRQASARPTMNGDRDHA